MRLRLATINDLDSLAVLGKAMHVDSTFSSMDYDGEVLKENIINLINDSQFVAVAELSDRSIAGVMIGIVTQSLFGKDMVANDLALFVRKDKRGGFIAYRLIDAFVKWAKLAGAKQIRPGTAAGGCGAENLYERLGFKRCGSTYLMEGV